MCSQDLRVSLRVGLAGRVGTDAQGVRVGRVGIYRDGRGSDDLHRDAAIGLGVVHANGDVHRVRLRRADNKPVCDPISGATDGEVTRIVPSSHLEFVVNVDTASATRRIGSFSLCIVVGVGEGRAARIRGCVVD